MKLPDPAEKQKGVRKLKLTTYDRIKESEVDWLMPGYIARGKFTLLWGLEGKTKSYLTLGIAAHISNGIPLPGVEMSMQVKPRHVLLFTYEDDQSQDIKPRLMRCGADMNYIHTMCVEDGSFSYKDVEALAATADQIPDLTMMVIDPLTEFIGGLDENAETVVREAMRPLTQFCAKKNIALLGVKHANKKEDAAISNRVSGSRAWTALARSVILAGHDNQKENTQFNTYSAMMSTKANLNGLYYPWTYEIDHGVFKFGPQDPTITPDRLFPVKVKKPDGR
jgi:RecA-family ATPase